MKRTVLERSFVVVLFILVMVAFSFAERDTQKLFEKYNTKSTVEIPKQTVEYTAEAPQKINFHKVTRN
ncbi:MAG TPA: hypothetical protein VL095_06160 [Flavisolibacter sp.]|nr:hypothetical protein [Flavisolibacter sp.]